MPVHCPLKIESLSTEEFASLDYSVMGHLFKSQNEIGRLANERVYQADVARRLDSIGVRSSLEVPVRLTHKTFTKTLRLDLVVSGKAVYELKTASALSSNHVAQLLTYLYLLDLPRGKLVNLRAARVESQFVNAPLPRAQRIGFSITTDRFRGAADLRDLVVDLVRDWGTSLSVSLYHEAVVHLLGGEQAVARILPLKRDGEQLAYQRFDLADRESAFALTAFVNPANDYQGQLQRLLVLSRLNAIHWINVGSHRLAFRTVAR